VAAGSALKRAAWLSVAVIAVLAQPAATAAADPVLDAARAVRLQGCQGRPGIRTELQHDPALDRVARRWAQQGGRSRLELAFEAERVRARESASLALLRTPPEQAARAMSERLCVELTTAEWTRIGWRRESNGLWLVLTVPSAAPAAAEGARIAGEVLRLVNAVRARGARCGSTAFGPAPPLKLNERLTRAAQVQASEMARYRYLAHEGRDGSTPGVRATRAGYAWRTVGENVAAGAESAEDVVRGWEKSPDHCHNLMDRDFTEMGIAFGTNPEPTGHSTWWSQVLARPK
jgi:uncharacterized protein YkwD